MTCETHTGGSYMYISHTHQQELCTNVHVYAMYVSYMPVWVNLLEVQGVTNVIGMYMYMYMYMYVIVQL